MRTINNRTLLNIVVGWVSTPLVSGMMAFVMMKMLVMLTRGWTMAQRPASRVIYK
jgi:phosphate/sulfate permease